MSVPGQDTVLPFCKMLPPGQNGQSVQGISLSYFLTACTSAIFSIRNFNQMPPLPQPHKEWTLFPHCSSLDHSSSSDLLASSQAHRPDAGHLEPSRAESQPRAHVCSLCSLHLPFRLPWPARSGFTAPRDTSHCPRHLHTPFPTSLSAPPAPEALL